MAKVHDKYVVELAEVIKGYGNDPDTNDPFCLSEFYRFYEVPNVCVSAENFKKMRPLSDYTEEIEPESISKWKKEFREYVDSLDIARDDWKGIAEYIDELPSAEPDTTTHDSIPAETGKNDGDKTSGDCISRQQAIDALLGITAMRNTIPLDSAIFNIKKLPSVQPDIIHCKDCAYCDSDVVDAPYGMTKKIFWCDRLYAGANENLIVEPDDFCSWAERREGG